MFLKDPLYLSSRLLKKKKRERKRIMTLWQVWIGLAGHIPNAFGLRYDHNIQFITGFLVLRP